MKNFKWIALSAVITIIVAAAVGILAYNRGHDAGFTAGLEARNSFLQARAGGGGGFTPGGGTQGSRNNGGQAGFPGNFTMGQIKSVNGNVMEVSTATAVVKVTLSDSTQIEKTITGATSDLTPGETVIVQGARETDGSVTARSVQLGAGRFWAPGAAGQTGQGSQ